MSNDFASRLPVPNDEMRPESHVIDLAGSNKPPARRHLQGRDIVSVTGKKLLLVVLQVEDGNFVSNREDQMLLIRVNSERDCS